MTGSSQVELLARVQKHGARQAVVATEGVFTYAQLLQASGGVAAALLQGEKDLSERRVALLAPPGFRYAASLLGIWRAGGLAVPLAVSHPRPELEYVIDDSQASALLTTREFAERLAPMARERGLPLLIVDIARLHQAGSLPEVAPGRRAMILYTSGTTGKPKGVVFTHDNIRAQMTGLISGWGWRPDDYILDVLPLHHSHGIIIILLCALWSGAVCELMPRFEAEAVWQRLAGGGLTLFMAVPTVYARLIAAWEASSESRRAELSAAAAKLRLMVSGSAALPVSVLDKWRHITGHVLLERYGTTETGIVLSNPLQGERLAGTVGRPLNTQHVRVVDEKGALALEAQPGELQVRGPAVFLEYWQRPQATAESFVDGWYRTGDVVVKEQGVFRIMGRSSVDIIKTGGFKVSALEIEETLREHPAVLDCAVVGTPDEEWGQRVAAAVMLRPGGSLDLEGLRAWAKEFLAPYKVPSRLRLVEHLPRNPMGKVTKKQVVALFEQ
ncbi:MAG: long-chain fatty acid--CoA ligase [Desulfarculus sp.]|jgi:malonyl-CoA/methylmalonyl-CoA synthetase|nr:MAG: long-chain fatty acid--CoA ligase [Desulfarculus sp.]